MEGPFNGAQQIITDALHEMLTRFGLDGNGANTRAAGQSILADNNHD